MKILMVSCESVPFSKSGGLADVVGALTPALVKKGHDARIFVPAYNTNPEDAGKLVTSFSVPMLRSTYQVEVRLKTVGKTKYYFLCHPMYCSRLGIYGDTSFTPYSDNMIRFTVLSKAALLFCENIKFKPDVFHCHDWTSGLLPYFLKTWNSIFFKDCKSVFTIHNLAYQGNFLKMDWLLADEKPAPGLFKDNLLNMMQSGLVYSDFITTVSPTYAKEIQTQEQGCNLEEILIKKRTKLRGIVNGIDINEWNPMKDSYIPYHFSASKTGNKAKVKSEVQKRFNLPLADDVPVFAMISRLASQKGFDALVPCLETLLKECRLQFVIIGTGDSRLESKLLEIADRNDNLSVNIMFSNSAAHLVEAGADFFLMPSRYEPCGLNQLYSLRYGTIPIARRTGGLADTITDLDENPSDGTGFLFDKLTPEAIEKAVKRAVDIYNKPGFDKIRARAMNQDFSWANSADEYIRVYQKIKKKDNNGGHNEKA